MTFITGIGAFALLFGLLVFFHELGHFLAAKWFRMKVEEFAFGFAWPLLKVRVGETQYTVRALPLGGFVRIAGMEIEDEAEVRLTGAETRESYPVESRADELEEAIPPTPISEDIRNAPGVLPPDHPDRFNNRPPYQRFLVYLAGPLFSFVFGWLALCLVGVVAGIPDKTTMAVAQISPGSVADKAGLKVGETVVALDGKPVENMPAALDKIHESSGIPIEFTLRSESGQTRTLTLTPEAKEVNGQRVGLIGFVPQVVILSTRRLDLMTSFKDGTEMTRNWFIGIFGLFKSGAIKENVGGPVKIFEETVRAAKDGGPAPLLLFGQLSLSLGFFNLFPIPILDGGHMLLITMEVIRRKKLSAEQTHRVIYVGLAVIMLLFVVVMFKDISSLFAKK